MNSWCKVENGVVVDGPMSWPNGIPPDQTWLPHRVEELPHTINDNLVEVAMVVSDTEVVEQKRYAPKPQEQIDSEIADLKANMQKGIDLANEKLSDESLKNKQAWQDYKDACLLILDVTELSFDLNIPQEPVDS